MSVELQPDAPHSPLISCALLPTNFITCEDPLRGCSRIGGQKYHEVELTTTNCTALPEIECSGNRTFSKGGIPCIKYTNHYFLTTLLYSILLGLVGIDRFCLGHVGAALGKLLTLGGLGVWWLIDIILLINGQLMPEDESNWMPYV